jgi:hypothetical protein
MGVLFCVTAMSGTGADKARVALERLEATLGAEDRKVVAGRNRIEAILQTVLPAEEG